MMWSENPSPDTTYIQYLIQENKKNKITDFSVNEDAHLNKIAEEWTEILAVQDNIEKESRILQFYKDYRYTYIETSKNGIIRSKRLFVPELSEAKKFLNNSQPPLQQEEVLSSNDYTLVLIPKGEFQMGCSSVDTYCREDEKPPFSVRLSYDFWMGQTEVTQRLYFDITKESPSDFGQCGDYCPVENVNFFNVIDFLNTLSERENLEQCYRVMGKKVEFIGVQCNGYRLPTEAEWEYAARAGDAFLYSGSNNHDEVAWHGENSKGRTHPVGSKNPNKWFLYDMSGNVLEWCNDWYLEYEKSPKIDPLPTGVSQSRVGRGGSWYDNWQNARVSDRYFEVETFGYQLLGFRIARTHVQ